MQKIKMDHPSRMTRFLYRTWLGRMILKILTLPFISKIGGLFMNSFLSKGFIKSFVKKNQINLRVCEKQKFKSYNDFFTRKIQQEYLKIDQNHESFIAPCDAKLQIFKIEEGANFKIKNSYYSIQSLLKNDPIYQNYIGGYLCIYRLCVDDYHRYIYLDEGMKEGNHFIKGRLHTVQPIALEKYNIYKTNSREYTLLHTKNFGDVIQMEIGALMVGKIKNFHASTHFKRGEEKGMFLFGGSTICVLVKKNCVEFNPEILKNTSEGYETIIKLGEKVGVHP